MMSSADNVIRVRPIPAPPADMIAGLLLWNSVERTIERGDFLFRPCIIIRELCRRNHHVVFGRKPCIVDLHDQPGIGDRLVFRAQRFAERQTQFLFRAVVFVAQALQHAGGRDYRQKSADYRDWRASPL